MQRTTLRTLQRRSSRFGKRLTVIEAILLASGICASYGSAKAVIERCTASLPLRFTQLQAETGELRGIAREHPEIEFERFALDFRCRLVLAILSSIRIALAPDHPVMKLDVQASKGPRARVTCQISGGHGNTGSPPEGEPGNQI